jgi:hypothetical protein
MKKPFVEIFTMMPKIREFLSVYWHATSSKLPPLHWSWAWQETWKKAGKEFLKDVSQTDDATYLSDLTAMATWEHFKGKIYKIGEEFGRELNRTDLNLPGKCFPGKDAVYCIELPDSLVLGASPRTKRAATAFVITGNYNEEKVFSLTLVYEGTKDPNEQIIHILNFAVEDEVEIGQCVVSQVAKTEGKDSFHKISWMLDQYILEVVRYVAKCILYINCGNPDLREYRAPKCERKGAKKIKQWERKHRDDPLVDMIYVGFDFKKPRAYKEGETWIESYPRWQRYGKDLCFVKWIWVTPHPRKYHKKEII